jgi:hypothetical protein
MTISELVDILGEDKAKELVDGKGGDRIPISAQRLEIKKTHIRIRELHRQGVSVKQLISDFKYSKSWIYELIKYSSK